MQKNDWNMTFDLDLGNKLIINSFVNKNNFTYSWRTKYFVLHQVATFPNLSTSADATPTFAHARQNLKF